MEDRVARGDSKKGAGTSLQVAQGHYQEEISHHTLVFADKELERADKKARGMEGQDEKESQIKIHKDVAKRVQKIIFRTSPR